MNDSPVKSCPKCPKRKAKRLLGIGAGLIFKGTGFYETDYKNKSGGDSKEDSGDSSSSSDSSDSSATSSDSSSSSSTSESKPKKETKSESKPKKKDTKPKS